MTAAGQVFRLCVLLLLLCPSPGWSGTIIFEKESPYHLVRVIDREDGHLELHLGNLLHNRVDPQRPYYLYYQYSRAMFAALAFMEDPEDVLFVGMGAGDTVKFLRHHYPETRIDAVEIDPVVVEAAKRYFSLEADPRMEILVRDGRVHLRRTRKKYDIIFLDAYNQESVPFHLTTVEFLQTVKKRLKPGGVVVGHIWAEQWNDLYPAQVRTYREAFPLLYRLPVKGSVILLAGSDAGAYPLKELVHRAGEVTESHGFHFDLLPYVEAIEPFDAPKGEVPLLTDDHAPVDLLLNRKSE